MAGDRLGMKAPVERVPVFSQTVRAERKASHGGLGAVIRDTGDDAEAGTAVGAGNERIMIATVARVEQFPQAVRAEG